jgi:flagellar biosynthesis/type III secretory pathway chaperone
MNKKLHPLYDPLISLLRKEIVVCRDLHASLMHEREILSGSSPDELHESNARKEACILKAGMLEDARAQLIGKIAATLGLDGRDLTLSALLSYGDDSRKKELKECRSALRSLLTKINDLNERNKKLLDASLSGVQKSIDFLGQLVYPGSTYLNTGRLKANNLNGKILSREG